MWTNSPCTNHDCLWCMIGRVAFLMEGGLYRPLHPQSTNIFNKSVNFVTFLRVRNSNQIVDLVQVNNCCRPWYVPLSNREFTLLVNTRWNQGLCGIIQVETVTGHENEDEETLHTMTHSDLRSALERRGAQTICFTQMHKLAPN